jgi:hypothetical protein
MQEFFEGGLKYNLAILTAFVQFLTKQTGGNVSLGVGRQIKTLTDSIATLKGLVAAATAVAKEALQAKKEANRRGTIANTNANAAKNAVNLILSWEGNLCGA